MRLTIHPGAHLSGTASVPGDKSISHRAALFAALADGESRVAGFLVSGVTQAMLRALTGLQVPWRMEGETLFVQGRGLHGLRPPAGPLDCGNSATTLRLLAGALAAAGIPAMLDGSPGLRRRPMERIVEPLGRMGAAISAASGGGAPLLLAGRPAGTDLKPIQYALPVASAQVKSCLLLAALGGDGPSLISEPTLSRDHTERMLASMGAGVESLLWEDLPAVRLTPPAQGELAPLSMSVPGDFSAAAFLMVAALAVPGSQVTLQGVGLNPTRTGLLLTLQEMGADITIANPRQVSGEPVGDLLVRGGELHGVSISGGRVVDMIDEFPVLAVAAAFANGRTEVHQAEELRYKESDRINAVCNALNCLKINVTEIQDGFIIKGTGMIPGGAVLDPLGDHRLAMSMALAGLRAAQPVIIENADILSESFPGFPAALRELGATILIDGGEA